MPQNPKRRLAAILFADIVGYTAMMQRNEQEGLATVHRFNAVMETQVQAHQGEILEFRGDGCLVVFDSAVEAVHAAKAIQEQLREPLAVPLRIGIHLGDIVFTQGNIYGDGVNLASRVESMGVPGSILVTERVIHDVKSHPEFEMTSLGRFQFKNVEKPMEVFAVANEGLAVPRPEEMKGKGDRIKPEKSGMKAVIRLASVGFVAMAIGAVLFWALGSQNPAGQLSEEIIEERVAIIPFNNRTTNSNLEVFGVFCSDLITNGLTEAGVKTCSPRTIQQYGHLIGILPNNPEGKTSFSEVVGARYWVEGYFSQIGDTITVKSYLTDGLTGDVLRNFPDVKGHMLKKEQLADQLTRRIMGYWVAKDVIDRGKFKTPKYEAFQEYLKIFTEGGIQGWSLKHAVKAFALDTTFYLAALEELFQLADQKKSKYDTLYNRLAPHFDQMTQYEQIRFNAYQALHKRDFPNYVKYNEALFKMFPQDLSQTAHYSFHLGFRENKPSKAWEISNSIDWYNVSEGLYPFRKRRMWFIAILGLGAHKYQETIEFLDAFLPNDELNFIFKSIIYARTQRLDSLYSLADRLRTHPKLAAPFSFTQEYDFVDLCNTVAEEFLLQGNQQEANKFLKMAIDWTEEKSERLSTQFDSLDFANTYRLLGKPQEALLFEEFLVDIYRRNNLSSWKYKSWFYHRYLSGVAIDYANSGQKDKAREIIELFQSGWGHPYFKARIYAVLGETEKAMGHCEKWKSRKGWSHFSYQFYKHDYFMQNMNGYPPYEEFTRLRD